MKKYFLTIGLCFISFSFFAQDISPKEVPSVIRHNFQSSFPKASDIEWEIENGFYKVEFEIGLWNNDHSIWYDNEGNLIRHKKDISKSDLPDAIRSLIKENYRWYWLKDVEQITEGDELTYKVELKSLTDEWDVIFDPAGTVISKIRD